MKTKKSLRKPVKRKIISIVVLFGLVTIIALRMYQGFAVDLIMKDILVLEKEEKALYDQTEKLRSRVARLKNIDRISRIAGQKLGLIINTDQIPIVKLEDFEDYDKIRKQFAKKKGQQQEYTVAGVHK